MNQRFRAARHSRLWRLKRNLIGMVARQKTPRLPSGVADRSRRRFLQAATLSTGMACVGLPLWARAQAPRIVIVGAGLAGLNAAYQLQKAGLRAELYEASERTGGRVKTLQNVIGPQLVSDLGGSFIDSIHTEMRTLAKELEVPLLDYEDDDTLNGTINWFGNREYTDEQVAEAVAPFLERIGQDYRRSLSNPEQARRLDALSIRQYMSQLGIEGWIRDYLDVLFKMEMGLDCDEQSALTFIAQLAPIWDGEKTMMFDLHDERYLVKDGAQRLPDALAKRLTNQIHLSRNLESVRATERGYSLYFSGMQQDVKAEMLVLALPFSVLRHLDIQFELPAQTQRAITELSYGTNSKIIAGFKEKVWRNRGYQGDVLTDLAWQTVWDSTAFQPGPAGGLTFFFGGREGITLINKFKPDMQPLLSELNQIFPGLTEAYNGHATIWDWTNWAFSRGSYSCYTKGQWTSLVHAATKPVGNLFFAGEHCSLEFNGFMNGAAESGHRVADAMIKRLANRETT